MRPHASLLALALLVALPAQAAVPATGTAPAPVAAAATPVTVHKSPTCGCCKKWIAHLEDAGFVVTTHETDDLRSVKQALGMPMEMASCHTAEVDGYVVEGHVPATDIRRLLEERPDALGLAVPGMPIGSPGMEMADGRTEPYATLLVGKNGSAEEFARHGSGE